MKSYLFELDKPEEFISYYIIKNGNEDITNLKLQLLLYFIGKDYYIKNKVNLFMRSTFCCLRDKKGKLPYIASVYYTYCSFGGFPIQKGFISEEDDRNFNKYHVRKKELNWLDETISRYNTLSLKELVDMYQDDTMMFRNFEKSGMIDFAKFK